MKTASRMVGSAAFLSGYQAQDSPIYGAERRGAPVAAFTRIDKLPIRERGLIERPDILLIADETLLADPFAPVLTGQEAASVLFVNTSDPESIPERETIQPPVFTYDVSGRAREILGHVSSVSAGIAAAAARLCGVIAEEHLLEAVRSELEYLEIHGDLIEKNQRLAQEVFNALQPVDITASVVEFAANVVPVPYDHPRMAAPSIFVPGNATARHTGSWRMEEPVIDMDACTRCSLCYVLCPDGAIRLDEDGYPHIDYEHCKGCMICREVCPPKVIATKKEAPA